MSQASYKICFNNVKFRLLFFPICLSIVSVSSGHYHEESLQEFNYSGPAAVRPLNSARPDAGDPADLRAATSPQHPHALQVRIHLGKKTLNQWLNMIIKSFRLQFNIYCIGVLERKKIHDVTHYWVFTCNCSQFSIYQSTKII